MKRIIVLFLLALCVTKPAAQSEKERNWMGNSLPVHAQQNLLLPSQQMLEWQLLEAGLEFFVRSDLIRQIADTQVSAVNLNCDVNRQLRLFGEHHTKRRRSIVNCLLQNYPAATQQLWQEEDVVYTKLFGPNKCRQVD